MKQALYFTLAVGVVVLSACGEAPPQAPPEPPDTRAEDARAIEDAVRGWAAAAEAKDAAKFASFYADDGVLMMEDAPDVSGKAAIQEAASGLMKDPNFALSFQNDDVIVARSGDLAVETGTYTLTMTGPDDQPVTDRGQYLVVWEKQADGTWKAKYDVPVSDPPAGGAAPAGS